MNNIYLHKRALFTLLGIVGLFILGFAFPLLTVLGKIFFAIVVLAIIIEVTLLFSLKNPFTARRVVENKLSNGDFNPVIIQITSKLSIETNIQVIDEFPLQLQLRDKQFAIEGFKPNSTEELVYEVRPTTRGVYEFGKIHLMINTKLSFVTRKVSFELEQEVKVYPSFIQYRKFAFLAISNRLEEVGVKKIRKLGLSNEFEQIREYVLGDDYRIINWKATARHQNLMVNQYQEEKAQDIYCIIDKGRLMHAPFDGLSILDYSINAALVMSGVAIGKDDKAGLLTFSDKIGTFIKAQGKKTQMSLIADALYNQEVRLKESDYSRLYKNVRTWIKKRSFLILFTNFDSLVTIRRQMKYLKAIGRSHLLCVVIFDNSEINTLSKKKTFGLNDAYKQTMAEKFQHDKRLITKELISNGIYPILTEPNNLTVNTINEYLRFKSQGML